MGTGKAHALADEGVTNCIDKFSPMFRHRFLETRVQKSQDFSLYKTKSNLVISSIPKVSNAIVFSVVRQKITFHK